LIAQLLLHASFARVKGQFNLNNVAEFQKMYWSQIPFPQCVEHVNSAI